MPLVSYTSKEVIESEHDAITKLMEKCKSCDLLKGQEPNEVVTMSIPDYVNKNGLPAMIAIAQYIPKGIMAIYEPKWLTKKQMVVLDFFVRDDVEPTDKVIVFSQRTYDAIKSYSSKPVNVQLYD